MSDDPKSCDDAVSLLITDDRHLTEYGRKVAKQDLDLAGVLLKFHYALHAASKSGRWLDAIGSDSPEVRGAIEQMRFILECEAPNPIPALNMVTERMREEGLMP